MTTHHLGTLLDLGVHTAYYQGEEHKAVCEMNTCEDGSRVASVFVDGECATSGETISAALNIYGIPLTGWTVKPGQQ